MQLQQLSLLNFRNYRQATIKFFDGIHVLYGENGAGKTSILEAIYYLALTKSFRTTIDRHLINHEETMFRLQGQFQAPHGNVLNVTIAYTKESGKHLTVNQQKPQTFSEYIGEVPIVLLHPADLELSQGSPSYRRRFLDVLLSQSSKLYLHHLIQYTRSLKQRNQILQNPSPDRVLLSSWDENIITHGVEIVRKRKDAVLQLEKLVKKYYRQISQKNDEVTIHYRTTLEGDTPEEMAQSYRQLLAEKQAQEFEYGTTVVGPHRDDMLFQINGQSMREYASQGEHKTFVIALKLAEFHLLEEQKSQSPLLLFDDIFGELDAERIRLMLSQLSNIGQVFVTTTSRTFFDKVQAFDTPTHFYFVQDGAVEYQNVQDTVNN